MSCHRLRDPCQQRAMQWQVPLHGNIIIVKGEWLKGDWQATSSAEPSYKWSICSPGFTCPQLGSKNNSVNKLILLCHHLRRNLPVLLLLIDTQLPLQLGTTMHQQCHLAHKVTCFCIVIINYMIFKFNCSIVRFVYVLATREGAEPAFCIPWCWVPWHSCCSLA